MATAAILEHVNIACNSSRYPHQCYEVSSWSVQPFQRNCSDKMCGRRIIIITRNVLVASNEEVFRPISKYRSTHEGFFISLQYLQFHESLLFISVKIIIIKKPAITFLNWYLMAWSEFFKTIWRYFWHLECLESTKYINFKSYTFETKKIKSIGNWKFKTSFWNNRRLILQHP